MELVLAAEIGTSYVNGAVFSPNGEALVVKIDSPGRRISRRADTRLLFITTRDMQVARTIQLKKGSGYGIKFSRAGDYVCIQAVARPSRRDMSPRMVYETVKWTEVHKDHCNQLLMESHVGLKIKRDPPHGFPGLPLTKNEMTILLPNVDRSIAELRRCSYPVESPIFKAAVSPSAAAVSLVLQDMSGAYGDGDNLMRANAPAKTDLLFLAVDPIGTSPPGNQILWRRQCHAKPLSSVGFSEDGSFFYATFQAGGLLMYMDGGRGHCVEYEVLANQWVRKVTWLSSTHQPLAAFEVMTRNEQGSELPPEVQIVSVCNERLNLMYTFQTGICAWAANYCVAHDCFVACGSSPNFNDKKWIMHVADLRSGQSQGTLEVISKKHLSINCEWADIRFGQCIPLGLLALDGLHRWVSLPWAIERVLWIGAKKGGPTDSIFRKLEPILVNKILNYAARHITELQTELYRAALAGGDEGSIVFR